MNWRKLIMLLTAFALGGFVFPYNKLGGILGFLGTLLPIFFIPDQDMIVQIDSSKMEAYEKLHHRNAWAECGDVTCQPPKEYDYLKVVVKARDV